MNKNEKQGMKKSTKAIIAAAVALVLVAAVLIGIFVIKPAIEKKPDSGKTEITFSDLEQNEGENFEYVSFKGARMAKELALIFEQAEIDGKKAIKKDGYAIKIGDHEISKAELALYYMDKYTERIGIVNDSIKEKGLNATGFDLEKVPSKQRYTGTEYKWSDKLISEAIDTAKSVYTTFDYAVNNGFTLTEQEVSSLISSYSRIERFATVDQGPDGLIEKTYGEGSTYAMFAKREIMSTYAAKFEKMIAEKYYGEVTDKELNERLSADPDAYKCINVRIYPIQGDYEESQIQAIRTEKDFLDFAKNNYPEENYNAEVITKVFDATKDRLKATFGPEVMEWAFSKERKVGDFAKVTGQLYEYMVYICELPEYEYSHDLLYCGYWFNSNHTNEDKLAVYEEYKKIYEKMQNKQLTPEEFEACFAETEYYCEQRTSRAGDFYFDISDWMTDHGRNPGDIEFFNNISEGVFIVYYLNGNPEDLDWQDVIKREISNERYAKEYSAFVETYEIKESEKTIQFVVSDCDKIIAAKIEENKKA